jgi:hypothetical protein
MEISFGPETRTGQTQPSRIDIDFKLLTKHNHDANPAQEDTAHAFKP